MDNRSMIDLQQLREWQLAKPSRSAKIEMGRSCDSNYFQVWVYDYNLGHGAHVSTVEEIDLEADKKKSDRDVYEALKRKFLEVPSGD